MMTNKFNIGDIVITLVDKIEQSSSGPTKCLKNTKATVCAVYDDHITIDTINSNGKYDTFDYELDEIALVKSSNL